MPHELVRHGVVLYDLVRHAIVLYDLVGHGIVFYDLVRHGKVLYETVPSWDRIVIVDLSCTPSDLRSFVLYDLEYGGKMPHGCVRP